MSKLGREIQLKQYLKSSAFLFKTNFENPLFRKTGLLLKKSIGSRETNFGRNGEFRFNRPNNGWADDPKRRTNLVWKS